MKARVLALLLLSGLASSCSESYVIARKMPPGSAPACSASEPSEQSCGDGADDDCDGFTDCLDPDCQGQRCAGELTCVAGACLACQGAELCAEELPPFDDIRVETRGDTAIVEFSPVLAAVDYRIYPLPEATQLGRDAQGRRTVRDAIYRCAGRRTAADRAEQYGALFSESLLARDNGYTRSADEATLGYVFTHAGPGRLPVYRLADPDGNGGYFNAEWIPPLYKEGNSAEYVVDADQRAQLLRRGFRDDGIAFYVPERGDLAVYRASYRPDAFQGSRVSFFFSDGPEHQARSADATEREQLGPRFQIAAQPAPESVALHRVTYRTGSTFDVLAAGEAAYQHVLHQAGPVTSLTWSGLGRRTVLVIEALDAGCPFPNAYVGAFRSELGADEAGESGRYPTDTLDALRSAETGEVFVNGQHDPSSRPRAIARSFVSVEPRAQAAFDFSATFDDPAEFDGMREQRDQNAVVYRNQRWSVETTGCGDNFSFGVVLGQLFLGLPQCRVSLVPRGFTPRIAKDRFLHVRMASDLPSTSRRYPQLLITSATSPEVGDVENASELVIHNRLGPLSASELPGPASSIIVQPYFTYHEAQIQFCGRRGWGPTVPCPRANIYGYEAGEPSAQEPGAHWLPVPVLADRVGFDRPVLLDVYASTERVYLFVDGRPTGCAQLPAGQMPEGQVTVAFRAILDEPEKDEHARQEPGRQFERELSLAHSDRRMDDFGIELDVPEPSWDQTVLPCARRWYGGQLIEP